MAIKNIVKTDLTWNFLIVEYVEWLDSSLYFNILIVFRRNNSEYTVALSLK